MPSASFEHRVEARARADSAWNALQVPETWRSIGGADRISQVMFKADGTLAGYRFSVKAGGVTFEGKAIVREALPGRSMDVAIETSEVDGTITVRLDQPSDDRLIVSAELTVRSKTLLSSLFFPVISEALSSEFPIRVETFAAGL